MLKCIGMLEQVVSSINNLIIGKIYVDHGGTMRIHSSANGLVCKLKFREQGVLRMREAHEVSSSSQSQLTAVHVMCFCLHVELLMSSWLASPVVSYTVISSFVGLLSTSKVGACARVWDEIALTFAVGWQVRGHLELPTGEKIVKPLLFGKWDEAMYAEMPDNTQRLLWQKSEPPPDPTR